MLTLEWDQYSALAERARSDDEERYAKRLASPGPVTASFAGLRGLAPCHLRQLAHYARNRYLSSPSTPKER